MPYSGVKVEGLRELNRSFAKLEKHVRDDLRGELKHAAEPVRLRAEQLAEQSIRNAAGPWTRMRSGVTTRTAYVAPAARRRGGSPRPKFGGLLMGRAMEPAAEQEQDEVVRRLEAWLDSLADRERL